MTVYLVDFENVRSEGLKGVEQLSADDKVVIFYSKNANSITFDVHALLSKSAAEIETYRILRGGHNSLDFQLSTYLGYLVMENSYKEIVIISKDKGFLCVTNFWEENPDMCNCKMKLCKSIRAAFDNIVDNDIEDGLTGKFIERVSGKDGVIVSINGEDIGMDTIDDFEGDEVMESARQARQAREAREAREAGLDAANSTGEKRDSAQNIQQTQPRSYGRPQTSKRTNFGTNIFTKTEPYYRVPNTETARARQSLVSNETPKNEPWKQKAGDKKPWRPMKTSGRKRTDNAAFQEHPAESQKKGTIMNQSAGPIIEKTAENTNKKVPENINPQNPTSKNKIFAAEIKLNIDSDVRDLLQGKYDESYVAMLVEAIGLSTGKQHFYKMMVNKVGQEQGLDLYRMIKGHYANLKRK